MGNCCCACNSTASTVVPSPTLPEERRLIRKTKSETAVAHEKNKQLSKVHFLNQITKKIIIITFILYRSLDADNIDNHNIHSKKKHKTFTTSNKTTSPRLNRDQESFPVTLSLDGLIQIQDVTRDHDTLCEQSSNGKNKNRSIPKATTQRPHYNRIKSSHSFSFEFKFDENVSDMALDVTQDWEFEPLLTPKKPLHRKSKSVGKIGLQKISINGSLPTSVMSLSTPKQKSGGNDKKKIKHRRRRTVSTIKHRRGNGSKVTSKKKKNDNDIASPDEHDEDEVELLEMCKNGKQRVSYSMVVKASAKRQETFKTVVNKYYDENINNPENIDINMKERNEQGKIPLNQAILNGYNDIVEKLIELHQCSIDATIPFDCVIAASAINDPMFQILLVEYMKEKKINDLKTFSKKINWDLLKKNCIYNSDGFRKSQLLRDICEKGVGKKRWIYIAIRLDYNLDQAIKNAKKIPNMLISIDNENNDKKNVTLIRKYQLKKQSKKIDDWYVGDVLGNGAFGEVRLGINPEGKRVALKFIQIDASSNEKKSQSQSKNKNKWGFGKKKKKKQKRVHLISFIAGEISNIQKVDHENVIRLLAFNLNVDKKIMLVFEYAVYGELYQVIGTCENRRVDFQISKYILSQILSGLDACHSVGIIHRDIKPQNILVAIKFNANVKDNNDNDQYHDHINHSINESNRSGMEIIIKISDFGLSGVTQTLAQSNELLFVGTRGYISPEIAAPPDSGDYDYNTTKSKPIITSACDIFSAGVVLWQMIYGVDSSPFDEARENDSKYYYIAGREYRLFWKCHPIVNKVNSMMIEGDREKKQEILNDLKELFMRLFESNPHKRITVKEIYKNKWFNQVYKLTSSQFTQLIQPYATKARNIQLSGHSSHSPKNTTSAWISRNKLVCHVLFQLLCI